MVNINNIPLIEVEEVEEIVVEPVEASIDDLLVINEHEELPYMFHHQAI